MNKFLCLCLALVFLDACNNPDADKTASKQSFIAVTGIDSSVKPGDNFFRYVNGKWYDTAKIADDQTGVGSYMFLNIPQKMLLQNILDSVSKTTNTPGSIDQKVGDFYASGMDTTTINQRGYEPIRPILARIDSISDVPSLIKFVASEMKTGQQSIIGFSISADNKNGGINIAHVYQAGIGLPDRDYYFKTDSSSLSIQQAYKKYISTLFQLTGTDATAAGKNADVVYGIEKQMAASHKTNIELRDVNANYHKTAVASIGKTQPNISWEALLANLDAKTDSIDMAQPAYYDKLNTLLKSISINDWKTYLKAGTLESYAGDLSKPFVDATLSLLKYYRGRLCKNHAGR